MRWSSRYLLLLVVALPTPGCGGADAADPCAADKHECTSGSAEFVREPRCKLNEPLMVELGQGPETFEPIPADSLPAIHHGSQGGMHTFLAVRVLNPALDKYDTLLARFELVYHLQSGSCAGGVRGTGGADECQLVLGSRELVLGVKHPLQVVEGGVVEEQGILVLVDSNPSGLWRVSVAVEDPCGRVGLADHDAIITGSTGPDGG